MHHNELGIFLEAIQDYFLVSSFTPDCHVLPCLDHDTGYKPSNGIKIVCNLQNGHLEALINNPKEDSNQIILSYWNTIDKDPIFHEDILGLGGIRYWIKDIIVLDMAQANNNHETDNSLLSLEPSQD